MTRRSKRAFTFAVVASLTALSLLASAQPKRPARPSSPPAPMAKGPPPKAPSKPDAEDAREVKDAKDARDAGVPPTKEDKAPSSKDVGASASATSDSKAADGGARVFRFGEVEVEGRLKSPQIVYFLRRVRAEFAANDLGHRTFVRELSETRNEPSF